MKFSLADIHNIAELLKKELPGVSAHRAMAPYQRDSAEDVKASNKLVKHASTMMLLYPKNNEWYFALMLRPDYDGVHGGQVSFPGGKREEGETPATNALRELEEEIGIDANLIKILGQLTEVYIPPSNMLVAPFVGMINSEPIFRPDPIEVERVLEVKLEDLFKEDVIKQKKIQLTKYTDKPVFIDVPYFELCLETVWGATALILNEFKTLFK